MPSPAARPDPRCCSTQAAGRPGSASPQPPIAANQNSTSPSSSCRSRSSDHPRRPRRRSTSPSFAHHPAAADEARADHILDLVHNRYPESILTFDEQHYLIQDYPLRSRRPHTSRGLYPLPRGATAASGAPGWAGPPRRPAPAPRPYPARPPPGHNPAHPAPAPAASTRPVRVPPAIPRPSRPRRQPP